MDRPLKILLVRFSSIGDIVLTTPVIRCLKKQLNVELHYLTKKAFSPLLASNPYIDHLHTFNQDISEIIPALIAAEFDHVIDLHHNLRTLRVKWALKKNTKAFNKLNFEKWLLVNTGLNFLPPIHIVDRYMATVAPLGVTYDGDGLDHFIPETEVVSLSAYPTANTPAGYLAFVLGATHATKTLPREKMLEICNSSPLPIALLGGAQEAELGAYLEQHCNALPLNFCGKLNIHQSASLIQQAKAVLTHDTGLMHIAAALRKPIVSLWGSTVPAFGMYPFYPQGTDRGSMIEVKNLSCRPCSKIGYQKCPKGHFRCMYEISVPEIWEQLSKILH